MAMTMVLATYRITVATMAAATATAMVTVAATANSTVATTQPTRESCSGGHVSGVQQPVNHRPAAPATVTLTRRDRKGHERGVSATS